LCGFGKCCLALFRKKTAKQGVSFDTDPDQSEPEVVSGNSSKGGTSFCLNLKDIENRTDGRCTEFLIRIFVGMLKVDCNEKIMEVGKETVSELQSGIVAIKGYLNVNLSFACKPPYFRFRMLQLN
jgi:hypothetical protein